MSSTNRFAKLVDEWKIFPLINTDNDENTLQWRKEKSSGKGLTFEIHYNGYI